ncbi:MAG: glucosaminidase domain-containing protein [Paramuribaculum sp.]|nr:glucosaminidase domain-containing protein [Paramuribaculum sp.]
MKTVITFLLIILMCTGETTAGAKKRKPLNKIQQDTIVIPEDIIFEVMQEEITADKDSHVTEDTLSDGAVTILGRPEVDVETMYRYILSRNPEFDREIAEAFYHVGEIYGVRGDIALCQSALETGWFKFTGGTAVTPDQHNYCGLGVTRLGLKGHSFDTIEDGVTAQIQHLYAYACNKPLPKGEVIIDPRFTLVTRGVAPTWQDLNNRWAMNSHYADRILTLFRQMKNFKWQ